MQPVVWMALVMRHGDDLDLSVCEPIDERVWIPSGKRMPASVGFASRIAQRRLEHRIHSNFELEEEAASC